MNCKYCNEQIPEDSSVCPVCGKELNEESSAVETVEETAVVEAAVEETATTETAANSAEHRTAKPSKGLWISGSILLGFQIFVSSRSAGTGYQPFVGATSGATMLYDLIFFLSSNFLGVIGFFLLVAAAIRTFNSKNTALAEDPVERTVTEKTAVVEEAVAEAQPEAPTKASTKKITAAVIAVVLVAAILIGLVAGGLGGKSADSTADTAPAATEPVVIPSNGDPSSPQCKASYTVSDEEAASAADVVVAAMGDKTLTNGQLQAFYWQELYMFLNEYGNYAQFMGLDVYKGLDEQLMMGGMEDGSDVSWQQFFLDGAIDTWKNYQAMELAAESAGHRMPEDMQKELNEMPANLEAAAVSGGFENADAMIGRRVGNLCTLDSYMEYADTYYRGMAYYTYLYENLNPTDKEVEDFFTENEEYFNENGVVRDSRYVNVRHVLLKPEGGEADENGRPVYTDEAWEACRVQAEALYSKWQEGDKSEDSFAQLAMEHSVDGSAANGGLYENVYEGQMTEEFENWCFDESRKPGDHGLVKTVYGYHIMFFSAHRSWLDLARDGLINDLAYDIIPNITEQYTAQVDYSQVALSHINFG